ncbi:MAG: XamI family restriction endonuclease [Caldilineaceae bacterium]|nr:XamI family restriction endonuclease [Caldilineaceae bacterium]
MAVNRDKPDRWKADIAQSVDMSTDWFLRFAPNAFRESRIETTRDVDAALTATDNLTDLSVALLRANPGILPTLRMTTCPPLAAARLTGLAGVPANLVAVMERDLKLPSRMSRQDADNALGRIGAVIQRMIDPDIFVWIEREGMPSARERYRAATIVADRLCGSVANPIIRNAQERRQLAAMARWLEGRGFAPVPAGKQRRHDNMGPGTFAFRLNVPAEQEGTGRHVNIPIDVAIQPKRAKVGALPLLVEAKSAGDFTNVNKRRKEEAAKMGQLRRAYGEDVRYVLFLCGYFDSSYLGYEAAEGIDWVWEHRITDFEEFGL